MKVIFTFVLIFLLTGCATSNDKNGQNSKNEESVIPSYVTIPPITLPPISADIKETLLTVAQNTKGGRMISYDMDLLVLPATAMRAQYDFFELAGDGSAGVFTMGGTKKNRTAIYDFMQMATYPMAVRLLDEPNSEFHGKTIFVTPFIGVGTRITVTFDSSDVNGQLSLTALAAKLSTKKGSGSISVEQFGISRYGVTTPSVSGMELTPDNVDTLYRNIYSVMSQIWLADTSIQPMLVGYSIPGQVNIPARFNTQILEQILSTARKREVVADFSETMYREGRFVLNLPRDLESKESNPSKTTEYRNMLKDLEDKYLTDNKVVGVVSAIARKEPSILPFVSDVDLIKSVEADKTVSAEKTADQIIKAITIQNDLKIETTIPKNESTAPNTSGQ